MVHSVINWEIFQQTCSPHTVFKLPRLDGQIPEMLNFSFSIFFLISRVICRQWIKNEISIIKVDVEYNRFEVLSLRIQPLKRGTIDIFPPRYLFPFFPFKHWFLFFSLVSFLYLRPESVNVNKRSASNFRK